MPDNTDISNEYGAPYQRTTRVHFNVGSANGTNTLIERLRVINGFGSNSLPFSFAGYHEKNDLANNSVAFRVVQLNDLVGDPRTTLVFSTGTLVANGFVQGVGNVGSNYLEIHSDYTRFKKGNSAACRLEITGQRGFDVVAVNKTDAYTSLIQQGGIVYPPIL